MLNTNSSIVNTGGSNPLTNSINNIIVTLILTNV